MPRPLSASPVWTRRTSCWLCMPKRSPRPRSSQKSAESASRRWWWSFPWASVIYPKNITAEVIVRYVRALENASGNNVETLYRMLDGRVEAMEFVVRPGSTNIIGVPLQQLGLKKNLLVCSINRQGKIITPTGQDTIQEGDIVIVVTTHKGIRDLGDIVRY